MKLLFSLLVCSGTVVQAFSPSTSSWNGGHDNCVRQQRRLYATPSQESNDNPLSTKSFLSHAMLRVPSVDETVQYWTDKGATVRIQKEKPNGDGLLSAMVEMGCSSKEEEESQCFALELVSTDKKNYQLGNSLSYLGVSMLLQFQNNLLGVIQGEKPESQGEEPNGISIQSSASAPGDFLSRFALRSNNNLDETEEFYTKILGMESKAKDESMLCLRYDNDCFTGGVPTTLIFDNTKDKLEMGDCLDHIVIGTKADVASIYSLLQQGESKIFMKPTEMFGKTVMGLIDPNGYKVILAS